MTEFSKNDFLDLVRYYSECNTEYKEDEWTIAYNNNIRKYDSKLAQMLNNKAKEQRRAFVEIIKYVKSKTET